MGEAKSTTDPDGTTDYGEVEIEGGSLTLELTKHNYRFQATSTGVGVGVPGLRSSNPVIGLHGHVRWPALLICIPHA